MPTPPCRAATLGFTLVEVLVAFMIASLALVVLLRIFSTGLNSGAQADSQRRAVFWAESLLDMAGLTAPLAAGDSAGELSGGYRWHMQVAPYVEARLEPGPLATPYRVMVEVTWQDRMARRRSVVLTTVRLGGP